MPVLTRVLAADMLYCSSYLRVYQLSLVYVSDEMHFGALKDTLLPSKLVPQSRMV